ncbi:unnamed protein product [Durusdinium trenchii]|uniref:RNase H type-1 domain-containing protein n=1 Tax=Durusdinium trenchii TaxID=1381693 RepID=A0ABP0JPS6_9DINO
MVPGLSWAFKVDGRLTRSGAGKTSSRGVHSVVLGDVEYADDTQIFGDQEEVSLAENIFVQTLHDGAQQEHPDKREKLILCAGGRGATEVLNQFERKTLKHLGAFLSDAADYWPDTKVLYWPAANPVSGLPLKFAKRNRYSFGIRRALGLDAFNMREFNIADAALRRLVHWDTFEHLLHRQVLRWVRHIARMPISRLPKVALFGWPEGMTRHRSCRFTFPMWVKWVLAKHQISHMDWFRRAQKPSDNWLRLINSLLPRQGPSRDDDRLINSWRPGLPLPPDPAAMLTDAAPPQVDPFSDAEETCIAPSWPCPACPYVGASAKALQTHYDNLHAPQDPAVTTVFHSMCPKCSQVFVTAREVRRHQCPVLPQTVDDIPVIPALIPSSVPPALVPNSPMGWALYTDGAGPDDRHPGAGWGVAIWEGSLSSDLPNFELFGPVPTAEWDARWLGARTASNNTGELTAVAEALLWLEKEAPGPACAPATIWFDSTYAHDIITGISAPAANEELATTAVDIYRRISTLRVIQWCKVKGHSGNPGNDYADALADKGRAGEQTRHSPRWLLPVGSPAPCDPLLTDHCWRCGKVYTGLSHARQLAGHEAYCKVPGAPPASIPCRRGCGRSFEWRFAEGKRKQAHHAREFRHTHEKICRGSEALTRVCPTCDLPFSASTSDEMILQHRNG